ncbi:uncharacterized protein LOC112639956 [Camponotus floridanus]|uniref:uncharacterized protein LOC112639956 n=1 Tax=Camponotus floridanus TaxID=104421 RepID=UPI00059B8271|nr:uncharacterized protein LOC112639956 [Camponotus floridanus]XP_025271297.1 uncharacterized protein LOC112639956 [Camponotus floridanus]
MVGTKLFIYNIIIWLVTSPKLLIQAEEKLNNTQIGFNKTQSLKILPGIKFLLTDDKIIIHVKIQDLLQGTEIQSSRSKKNSLKKFGYMMMMAPFVMQIFSLPGAIASVKMSLLKTIMVAQLAIAIMIYNLIRNAQNSEVVVIHKKKHPAHYHHNYNYQKDDEDEWFGR